MRKSGGNNRVKTEVTVPIFFANRANYGVEILNMQFCDVSQR